MVDRLFWRAGFGPTAQDRATWTGKPLSAAVNWLLSTPAGLSGAPATNGGNPLDPTGDDTDLVLSWIDRMIRSTNPFVERLTFFWHRHWANSRDQVSPPQLLITQNNLFRRYADFSANPTANFRKMADDVTVDPSMLRYLTGESNVKGAPNENYARELMELFTLGVHDAGGHANYSQSDVEQLAKALSGWQINDDNPDAVTSYFSAVALVQRPKDGVRPVRELQLDRRRQPRPVSPGAPGVPDHRALERIRRRRAGRGDPEPAHLDATRAAASSSSRC